MDNDDDKKEYNEQKSKEFESFLRKNLPNVQYNEARDLVSDLTQGGVEMRSSFRIFKAAIDKVVKYKIPNCEYGVVNKTQISLSSNLARDEEGEIVIKSI